MARGQHAVGQFTRGWEVAGNFLAMARASVLRQLSWSLVAGTLIGGAWFAESLDLRARSALGDYVLCHINAVMKPHRAISYRSLGGRRAVAHQACKEIQNSVFAGRSLGFVFKQASLRVAGVASVTFILLTWLLIHYGKHLGRARRLRGSQLIDVAARQRLRHGRMQRGCLLLGSVVVGLSLACALGGRRLGVLGDYATAELCIRWPSVGRLLSADAQGRQVWFNGPGGQGGFQDPSLVHQALRLLFGGHTVVAMAAVWLGGSLLAGGVLMVSVPRVVSLWRQRSGGKQSGNSRRSDTRGLSLAGVDLARSVEEKHFLLCGSPGSGKSTAIKEMLDQIRARGEKAVVYDCSGEYLSAYYRPGRDILLNPMDARSAAWNIWEEVRGVEDYYTLGRSLFPAEGRDPFWADAGAQLFASVAEVLADADRRSNKDLADLLLRSSLTDLYDQLQGKAGARFMDPKAGPMPTNVLATVASKLGVWDCLSVAEAERGEPFSIRRFIESDDDRWLFLTSRRDQHETLKPLLSLWCDITSVATLSLPIENPPRKWVVLDEVATLQRLPALPPLLDLGRKHGASVVLGLQSIAQLRLSYGHDGAASLASEPQTWLVLRSVEPETAKWLEGALCSTEQEEVQESLSMGPNEMRDGVALQHAKHLRPVVMASELMTLPDLTGYLRIAKGGDPSIYRVTYPLRSRARVADGFMDSRPRTPVSSPAPDAA